MVLQTAQTPKQVLQVLGGISILALRLLEPMYAMGGVFYVVDVTSDGLDLLRQAWGDNLFSCKRLCLMVSRFRCSNTISKEAATIIPQTCMRPSRAFLTYEAKTREIQTIDNTSLSLRVVQQVEQLWSKGIVEGYLQ